MKILRYFYTYTPPCPRCGSYATGQYAYTASMQGFEKRVASAMKRGELIQYELGFSEFDSPNLYCSSCGIKWIGDATHKFLSKEEIEREKKMRGISDDLIYNTKQMIKISKEKMKKEKFQKRILRIKEKIKSKIRGTCFMCFLV